MLYNWKRTKSSKGSKEVENRTVQIKYKEGLRETKTVREQISLINDRKEEYKKEEHKKNHQKQFLSQPQSTSCSRRSLRPQAPAQGQGGVGGGQQPEAAGPAVLQSAVPPHIPISGVRPRRQTKQTSGTV